MTMAEGERRNKEREFNELNRDFQRKQREFREDLNQRRNEELAGVLDRANKTIRQIAEAESTTSSSRKPFCQPAHRHHRQGDQGPHRSQVSAVGDGNDPWRAGRPARRRARRRPAVVVRQIASLDRAEEGDLAFLVNPKYLVALEVEPASAFILPAKAADFTDRPRILTQTPTLLRRAAQLFNPPKAAGGIHPSAVVASELPASVSVGPTR